MNGKLPDIGGRKQSGVIITRGIKEFTVFETVEDGSKHQAGDGNDSAIVPTTALDLVITITVVGEALVTQSGKCTLHQQGFEVDTSPADTNGFLLPGALIIRGSKASPGTKVFRGMELGHIHADFREDSQSGEVGDARKGSDDLKLTGKRRGEFDGGLLDLFL